jgi:hypothetical protein
VGRVVVSGRYLFRLTLLVLLQIIIISGLAFGADDKNASLRQSALEYMDVGNAAYNRGLYTASEQERDTVIARWSDVYQYEGSAFWIGQ